MKAERLLYSIGMIDDKFIEEAVPANIISDAPKKPKGLVGVWRFAPVAACFVIVAAVVLFFWQSKPSLQLPPNESVLLPEQSEQDKEQSSLVSENNTDEHIQQEDEHRIKIYPLTINKSDTSLAASISIKGHFWRELTDVQLEAVFPNLPLPITATAHYNGSGSLVNVTAYEKSVQQSEDGISRYAMYYYMTEIQISPEEILEDVIYEYEAVISEVHGVPVVAGMFNGNEKDGVALYVASFNLEGIYYYIKLYDSDKGEGGANRLSFIVNYIISEGAADLSVLDKPLIPELRDEILTLDQAKSDTKFGDYLPDSVPTGFKLESAHRFINQVTDSLYMSWTKGHAYIHWDISVPTEYDKTNIVSIKEIEKYDMSLYSIPLSDSVPDELASFVNNPVFISDELTIDVVRARAYQVDDKGDISGPRMRFSVLYGDVLVSVYVKGVSANEVYDMLQNITLLQF